jgi:leucyl aminopeptidase
MLRLTSIDLAKLKTDILAIAVCEDRDIHDDPIIEAVVRKALKLKEFNAKKNETVTLYDQPDIKAQRVILWGLGVHEKIDREVLRGMAGQTVKHCIKAQLANLSFAVPDASMLKMEMPDVLETLLEGAYLGNHLFVKFKSEKKTKALKQIHFRLTQPVTKKMRQLTSKVAVTCEGTFQAKDWVNTPSNEKTPEKFTRSIVNLAKKQRLKVQVLDESQLKQKKFGALLAVAAGSQSKPNLVILEHKVPEAKKTLALVGKGVTFDSGGLNIKTGSSMSDMKSDMSGAAAVAATLIAAAKLKPKINIVGVIPIVENMPSGKATRPGDIIRSHAGKTIEIGNTDAEGRLILIDTISYVIKRYKPKMLIDLATLTGACVVALGDKIAGVFSNDDDLAADILTAAEKTHERCWRMPLPEDYKELLKSDFADMNNVSNSRTGGAITAALFLSEFAADIRWAHIDIAGPAYLKSESAYCGPGGTGFGVRLLGEVIAKLS